MKNKCETCKHFDGEYGYCLEHLYLEDPLQKDNCLNHKEVKKGELQDE